MREKGLSLSIDCNRSYSSVKCTRGMQCAGLTDVDYTRRDETVDGVDAI